MTIVTKYSIGDEVNLNLHDPNYHDETGIIESLSISIPNKDRIDVTYWYKVNGHLGNFEVKESGKLDKSFYE